MIGDHNESSRIQQSEFFNSGDEPAENTVEAAHGLEYARGIWSMPVAGVVNVAEIYGEERRPLAARQRKPLKHLPDPRGVRNAVVKSPPIRRAHASNLDFRA